MSVSLGALLSLYFWKSWVWLRGLNTEPGVRGSGLSPSPLLCGFELPLILAKPQFLFLNGVKNNPLSHLTELLCASKKQGK